MVSKKEKLLEKKKQIEAQIKAIENKEKTKERKERNGQLIAFGILVEQMFKSGDEAARQKWITGAQKHLKDRNLERTLAGFERLSNIRCS